MRPGRVGRDCSGYSPPAPPAPRCCACRCGQGHTRTAWCLRAVTRFPTHTHVVTDPCLSHARVSKSVSQPMVSPQGAPKRWGTHTATAPPCTLTLPCADPHGHSRPRTPGRTVAPPGAQSHPRAHSRTSAPTTAPLTATAAPRASGASQRPPAGSPWRRRAVPAAGPGAALTCHSHVRGSGGGAGPGCGARCETAGAEPSRTEPGRTGRNRAAMPLKAVILIGGPQKGTRFRPLSFEVPKPLFPVAGVPMVQHHIEACAKVPGMKEILLMGFYQPNEALSRFLVSAQQEFKVPIRYLQEYAALGTGGGIYHFRDQILSGGAEAFFVLNADVCSEFPLQEMLEFRQQHGDMHSFVILGTTANRTQALNYGCIVANADTQEVQHYVEKPSTFVSEIINCGIYLFTPAIFQHIGEVFQRNQQELALCPYLGEESSNGWQRAEVIRLEQDVFTALAGSGKLYVYKTDGFWSQIKSAGSAIYASRLYLNQYSKSHPERLAQNRPGGPVIRGNVYIHPTASIDSTAVLGPNVSIGEGVTVGAGVRVRESIVLHGASLHDHTCVLNTIVGWDSTIGRWARVEGTPSDPNPNDPYAKIDSETLFRDGRLTPSITILGCSVTIPAEVVILNSIVLPHKELSRSYKNQIIL